MYGTLRLGCTSLTLAGSSSSIPTLGYSSQPNVRFLRLKPLVRGSLSHCSQFRSKRDLSAGHAEEACPKTSNGPEEEATEGKSRGSTLYSMDP
ncbi:hypothetical protein Tco_0498755 [Tanacetum coccineum]